MQHPDRRSWCTAGLAALFCRWPFARSALGDEHDAQFRKSGQDRDDMHVYTVESEYQAGPTIIRVLLPDELDKGKRYRMIFVLPVEAKDRSRYGDGLLEISKHNLHNQHQVICVAPTFSHLPWYADHPTDSTIRQETYFVRTVVPFIERTYPTIDRRGGHLLLGFSKSGWGAWSLLLRHPEMFHRAAAWDAPLMMDQPNRFGMGPIFGTQDNFQNYRITTLLERQRRSLAEEPRLGLFGYGNFRDHHVRIHERLTVLRVPHIYKDGPMRKHDWRSGWVAEVVKFLLKP